MQRRYGLDATKLGRGLSLDRAGALVACLPENSLVKSRLRGDEPWGDELLLCSAANSLKLLPAQLSGRRCAVKQVKLFGPSQKARRRIGGAAATVAEIDRQLAGKWRDITREEALDGQH